MIGTFCLAGNDGELTKSICQVESWIHVSGAKYLGF